MKASQIKTEINLLELMRHSDDITAAFTALVAEGEFGLKGGAEVLQNVARTSGLCLEHLKGRYFVVIDNAARQLAGL